MTRQINGMFHTDDDGYLVKTSNGQRVPADEPVFILRARDTLAFGALLHYIHLLLAAGIQKDRISKTVDVADAFRSFATNHSDRMKQPGSTLGK